MWIATLICAAGMAGLLVWLRTFRLTIRDGVLMYTTLFRRTKALELSSIESASVVMGYSRFRDLLKPPLRLVIFSRDGLLIHVNLKVFRACEVDQLLSILGVGDK